MKFLAAISTAAAALTANTATTAGPLGSQCNPNGWTGTNAELITKADELNTAAAAKFAFDGDKAADKDTWAVTFSAGDAVCSRITWYTNARTTANPAALPAGNVPASTSATTCTGGWTAWTSAWSAVNWDDATTATIKTGQSCYTVAADTGTALDTPLKWDTIIDTYTVAGSGDKAAVVADKKVTVTNTVGLAGSSLLLWLFIILLLGGGGGAAYYFMVIAPTM